MEQKSFEPELSVVVLCYRAGESVRQFVGRIRELFGRENITSYELILVGNYWPGADDQTPRVVRELARDCGQVQCIVEPKQGAMGWDMRSGLALARGKYISVIDGDGQMPIEDIVAVYREIISSKADLVKTYRLKRGDSLWRKLISHVYNLFFGLLFPGLFTRDVNSKPKILTRAAYEKLCLTCDDWFIDAEIMIQARRQRFKIVEVPTVFLGLVGRRSFVGLGTVGEFIGNLIVYRFKEFFK